ncbi:M23 family metallopeptidase [Bacteroidales bacterium OttesenSCG-928-A17]|nr:M23 family metallopeptidase [Bacteroidales bacterium OttesenSCG-928-A17]
MKKKPNPKKKDFWDKMSFKYKLSFLNEKTLEETFSLRISRLHILFAVLIFAVVLITLTSVIIIKSPIRNLLPGYMDVEIRQSLIENALRTDSLEKQMKIQSLYFNNVNAILRGEIEVSEILPPDTLPENYVVNLEKTEETAEFVRNYEGEEKYNLSLFSNQTQIPDNITFYRPVRGVISSQFDAQKKHFGTDIAATPKESVLATLKGTVIYAGFDANAGYVIELQHLNGFVSVYKHNALLLKAQGDEVNAGEAIALVGNTGTYSTGNHLHFELWFRGKPVNPQDYIVF